MAVNTSDHPRDGGGPRRARLDGLAGFDPTYFPGFHAIAEDEIAEGNAVVQRIACYGTHEGEFSGVRPTGEQVTFQIIEINRAGAAGKFVERWSRPTCPPYCTGSTPAPAPPSW